MTGELGLRARAKARAMARNASSPTIRRETGKRASKAPIKPMATLLR